MVENFWATAAKDIVIAVVALYGAVLSTIVWRANRRKDAISVAVKIERIDSDVFAVVATNIGQRTATIVEAGLSVGKSKMISEPGHYHGDSVMPATITDGGSMRKLYGRRDIASRLYDLNLHGPVTLRPTVIDSLGNRYQGPPWPMSVEELLASRSDLAEY